jgi:PAS domain S-box-containing protein
MQHVKIKWLRIFNYSLVATSTVLFGVYFLFEVLQVSQRVKDHWGITPLVLTLAAVHAVFILITDRLFIKKVPWLITLVSIAMYAFLFSSIIESSGNTNVVYRIGYGLLIFFSGIVGLYPPLTAVIFTWMVLVFTITGIATPTNASLTFNLVVDTFLTIACFSGWYVFRRWYIPKNDPMSVELESMLQQEQTKSSVILESITDGVIVIDPKGTIQVINQSAAVMLGWEQQEAVKLDYRSLIGTEDDSDIQNETAITKSLQTSNAEQAVSHLKTRNGRTLYVDIVASPIFQTTTIPETDETQKKLVGVIAVLRDVDKQKRQEQQRSDFISTASHEMRTPVAAIQGFIELALNPKVTTIDEKAKGYLEKAHEATKHLSELFQDLLTVSKSDDGRLTNNPKVIELTELLKEIVEQNTLSAEKKGLKVVYENDASDKSITPLMYVNADPERLREVVSNLFDNAVKYTKTGMITIGASLKNQGVVLRVSDTGLGIANEDIPHLFQKFYRTDNTATREIGGTGLGLYICRQIVEMMGGRIWVESTVGAGSTFYVEIPRVNPESIPALNQA